MKTDEPAVAEQSKTSSTEDPVSWRELAVARVADPARQRAETRVQSFLDAAVELMNSDSGKDFTVQEVVERSGQSLRSFYQYFDGKHRLLLALFDESVRSTAEELRGLVAEETNPLDRLHRFSVEYYRLCRPVAKERSKKGPTPRAMAEFAQQLLTEHPEEAARAFVPLLSLLEELLDEAASAGLTRPGLSHSQIGGVVLQAIMFNAFASTISGSYTRSDENASAEGLWDLLLHGIRAEPAR
jgi:AcrR family transcriptional regulator